MYHSVTGCKRGTYGGVSEYHKYNISENHARIPIFAAYMQATENAYAKSQKSP